VVGGTYFDVMGLHPVLGRLINTGDDGPNAAGVAVLTSRFWSTAYKNDPTVIGKVVRLGSRSATIIGVLEPSVPYPTETEIIANVVTSPHHMSATMVTGREHRMTELFGRLAPGATIEAARADLKAAHAAIVAANPGTYSSKANFRINAVLLRDQITAKARAVLWVLLAASALIFVIACSNVANLILARSVRRESELAIRAALGAGTAALRRTLLAESVILCTTGAVLGVLSAQPMVSVLSKYAARFSVRALDLTLDLSLLWVGVGLAVAASVLLGVRSAAAVVRRNARVRVDERQPTDQRWHEPATAVVRGDTDRGVVHVARGRGHADSYADDAAGGQPGLPDQRHPGHERADYGRREIAGTGPRVLSGDPAAGRRVAWCAASCAHRRRAMA
jgi:hypothetical protein